ncbi:MAG: hypothetical protein HDT43_13675 [Ruminococcaceae bacterium]|nr:hypothetical protein [Oscillospiraceae bacterium]
MKKKTPLPTKITTGIAVAGMVVLIWGMVKEIKALALGGVALFLGGMFAGIPVSMIIGIHKIYPTRGDPYQRTMRALSYAELAAGCTAFLSVGVVMYGLYDHENGGRPIMNLGLALIAGGIGAVVVISVVMAVISKAATPKDGAKVPLPAPVLPSNILQSPDPVISRILANPYILRDERIRNIREVQNLLQYPEIQQIFFEPAKLYGLFEQERVGELLNIVRDWITRNNAAEKRKN